MSVIIEPAVVQSTPPDRLFTPTDAGGPGGRRVSPAATTLA